MTDFFAALGLAVFIEGIVYAAFPEQMKKWLAVFNAMPIVRIRGVALGAAAVGLVLLWMVRS
jgi:uncharacterized protein YjeT (DUF2065 family)